MNPPTLDHVARRSPWGLLGMIGLVMLVEGWLGLRALKFSDVDEWAYRWTSLAVRREVKGREILCFGDSLIKLSVVPMILGERTGKSTYNLALSGGQATTSYFVLKRAIDAGARPTGIIVDFAPELLRLWPRHNLMRWASLLDPFEAAQLARWSNDPQLVGELAVARMFRSIRSKAAIRANIMGALAGRPSTNAQWNAMALRNWDQNEGAQLMVGSAKVPDASGNDRDKLRKKRPPEWQCHPANLEGVGRFLALAEQYHIHVFWVLTPTLPDPIDRPDDRRTDRKYERFIRSWQEKYPNLVVLDARTKLTEAGAYWDPQHLSVGGASAFSRVLGDVLRESIARPSVDQEHRWVSVPPVKLGPIAPGIEDMAQSRLAVEAETEIRR